MPVGPWKNRLYRLALPFLGLQVRSCESAGPALAADQLHSLNSIFRRHYVMGGCLQLIREGSLGPLVTYGYSRLPDTAITPETVFRAASITKMVTAIGAMQLIEKGLLELDAPVEHYFPYTVRNPRFPDQPVLVRHLFTHTSGIWDGPGYDKALRSQLPLKTLLDDPINYLSTAPGEAFRYSNLAAGMIGSLMEIIAGKSLEALMQESVFTPAGMNASYTLKHFANASNVACIYRVLSKHRSAKPFYDPAARQHTADALLRPAPESHYLPAAGNLFTDAPSLGKLVCELIKDGGDILSKNSIQKMQTPAAAYGKHGLHARHCMGLVAVDDPALHTGRLYGHQGFAYGAAEGVFYQPTTGNGFVFLNSGASEARYGHLACVNRDLILWALGKDGYLEK